MESKLLEIIDERKKAERFARAKNPLVEALLYGSIVEIQDILREKYEATLSPENDWAKKCRQIINICLEKKLNVSVKITNYCALLHFVIKHFDEDFELVFKKCEKFDINAYNDPYYMHDTKSLLHFAIKLRKLNVVKILIEVGANVDVKDGREQTPLFYAVESKQIEIAEMLLKAKANVNAKDCKNMMPINFAFGERDETSGNEKYKPSKMVKLLCSYGAELDFKNQSGTRTLIMACGIGNLKEIEFLIEHGADLLSSDDDGKTALLCAAVKYNYNLVDFLLRRGVDINVVDDQCISAIHELSYIIENIEVTIANDGYNTYEAISDDWYFDFIGDELKKSAEMIEFLADNGADINTFNYEQITPLMTSVTADALEITECLLELNATIYEHEAFFMRGRMFPHVPETTDFSPNGINTWAVLTAYSALKNISVYEKFQSEHFKWIHSLFEECKEEVIKMQENKIWADREVSFFDFLNEDLLKVTKYFRNDDVLESVLESEKYDEFPRYTYLFEKRIERVQKMKNCLTVFIRFLKEFFKRNLPSVVIYQIINNLTAGDLRNFGRALCITEKTPNGKNKIIMELEFLKIMDERKNAGLFSRRKNPLEQALQFGSIVEIEDILCEKYQVTLSPENDWAKRCRQIINICLDKKLDVNIEDTNYCALLYFVMKHLDEDFESVINKCEKFNINSLNDVDMPEVKKSLLHLAINERKQNVVKILIEFGANVDVKDGCQQTPLFDAVGTKQIEVSEMLLKAGADISAKDSGNMMPINYAFGEREDTSGNEKYKPSNLVKLLCSYGAELDFKNESGNRTLFLVCYNGNLKEIEFLIAHGADLFFSDKDGATALNSAVLGYNYKVVDYLLSRGFDINAKDSYNDSLIHDLAYSLYDIYNVLKYFGDNTYHAISNLWNFDYLGDEARKASEMIEFLVDNGTIDINAPNKENITPLMIGVHYNALAITDSLLELNVEITDNRNFPYYDRRYPNLHVNPKFYCNKITTWVLLTAFLALKNIDIKDYTFSTHDNFEWAYSFYEECKLDVIKMKERRICVHREFSFFDFLTDDLMNVTKFCRNYDLTYVLEFQIYNEFPCYKYLFEKRVERVERIKNCQNDLNRCFKEFFKGSMPSLVIYQIIDYLTAADLRNFGRAFSVTE
ncbi:uncharacterized protein LOC122503007 [Leptopilina heterotoma]|uniref:uncharacterized protein LOC122503007 n=1 Tax=Leptopilina heterotoma TaxID=63436 RepID=UPI001CA8903C|nr:uncharacterized protein LOC122503007 [Leptopilina heterotoma]